jgi:hypothetical protein
MSAAPARSVPRGAKGQRVRPAPFHRFAARTSGAAIGLAGLNHPRGSAGDDPGIPRPLWAEVPLSGHAAKQGGWHDGCRK